jgi:predicted DNA-binding protein (MmcQ/YjbR family)
MAAPAGVKAERRARFADICLALPEATAEGERHVGFRVRGRTFAYYLDDHHGDGRVALNCKLPPGDLEPLVALDPDRFFVPAYLGARGWIGIGLDGDDVDWDEIARFVTVSYRLVAPRRLAAAVRGPG